MKRALLTLLLVVWLVPPLEAQTLRSKMLDLFSFGNCGQPLCLDGSISAQNGHGEHFIPSAVAGNSAIFSFIPDAIGQTLGSIPLSATSSGAVFTFVGGLPVRTASSAGPVFGERAQTLGRGRLLVGGNVTGLSFQRLRGVPLRDIELNFIHQDVGNPGLGDPSFEDDVIHVQMGLNLNLLVSTLFVTYGLLDRVDIGVAVPVVRSSLEGNSVAQIENFSGTSAHFFAGTSANPVLRASTAVSGSATGVGDVAARIKINFSRAEKVGFSVLADARLPTGDEQQLLGSGEFSARGYGILSSNFGNLSAHANLGYLYHRSSATQNDAFLATIGFDHLIAPSVTLAVDLISAWQSGENKLTLPGPVTFTLPFVRRQDLTNIPTDQRDNQTNASFGFKFTTAKGLTLVTNVILPLADGGLEPSVVWTGGLEYKF